MFPQTNTCQRLYFKCCWFVNYSDTAMGPSALPRKKENNEINRMKKTEHFYVFLHRIFFYIY